ncbi:hypothetical protein PanWU01x14_220180, partial [Parasponia andersonii]
SSIFLFTSSFLSLSLFLSTMHNLKGHYKRISNPSQDFHSNIREKIFPRKKNLYITMLFSLIHYLVVLHKITCGRVQRSRREPSTKRLFSTLYIICTYPGATGKAKNK